MPSTRSPLNPPIVPVLAVVLFLVPQLFLSMPVRSDELAPRPAHASTVAANEAVADELDLDDPRDFENSRRGFLGTFEPLVIENDQGERVWSLQGFEFLSAEPVSTVNPSLWRQEQLNNIHGLFEIHERIYQVRNFDLSNMTLIASDTGWIVIDPLISKETAAAAFALATKHLGERPIRAIVYSHSHADHFGGVRGLVEESDVESGAVRIVAPEGFMEHAVSENVLAGNAMNRRAIYQFGNAISAGVTGKVGSGLGKTTSNGTVGLIPPTDIVTQTGQELTIDGVRMVFQMANGSEAPSEFMFYLPDFRALCLSEVATRNMHNVLTLRGAQVRDALAWSKYINEAIGLFGDEAELAFASHHWPTWGTPRIREYLVQQRDLYRFMHDETLRLANLGLTPTEIAETMTLPASLAKSFSVRGYYGTLSHNVKAVYQRYFGWYDGVPAHLNPLPPTEAGRRYVDFMGGADGLLEKARESYEQGDFRWVAEVVQHLVFAQPENAEAKSLLADALEQLGYQAESGVWRNVYLVGARELRHGVEVSRMPETSGADLLRALSLEMMFDLIGVRLKRDAVDGKSLSINMVFSDIGRSFALELSHSVLNHSADRVLEDADATYRLSTSAFARLLSRQASFLGLVQAGEIQVEGDATSLGAILLNLETFDPHFNIVTP